jgi:hypothetical protein
VDGGTAVVIECCDGRVDGVEFQQRFFPSTPFIVPLADFEKSPARRFILMNKSRPPFPNLRRCSCSDPRLRRLR